MTRSIAPGQQAHFSRRWYVALFLLAFAARTGWIILRWIQQGNTLEFPDEALHWQLASNLVQNGTLVTDDGRLAARMPLYPLFLYPFAWLGPTGTLLARLAQAVLSSITVLLGTRLAHDAAGRRPALVAALLLALNPFAVFFSALLLTEVLFTVLLVGLIGCTWQLLHNPHSGWRPLITIALLGPLAILTRPSAALLIPLLWLLLLCFTTERRRLATRLIWCPVALVVLMLPWGLRNQAVLGNWAWLSTNGGVTLYDAQGPQADGSSDQSFLNEMPELKALNEVALDQRLQTLALEQMQRDPARVLKLAFVKLQRTWSPIPNVAEYRHGLAALAGGTYTLLVLCGGLIGLLRATINQPKPPDKNRHRQHNHLQTLLWTPILYFTLIHCIYIGSVRYRVPLLPLLAVGTATACTWRQDHHTNNNEKL